MTTKRLARVALLGAWLTGAATAGAQPRRPPRPLRPPPTAASPVAARPGLRSHFGLDAAKRLLASTDPDERLRGLERAAAFRTPESLTLLEIASAASASGGFDLQAPFEGAARKDPRALLVVVRALASWTDQDGARKALESVLRAGPQAFVTQLATSRDPAEQESSGLARVQLAREQAAIALARHGDPAAFETLLALARTNGPSQEPALSALTMFPPPMALFGGVALTTPAMVGLASATGDMRALDAIEGVLAASDPALRAAALAALAVGGDARVVTAARSAVQDHDPRVRVAAADALVRLETADAGPTVEALIGDPATALDGLRLALGVQCPGVTQAIAARAAAASDEVLRSAAVVALGRQTDPLAVEALVPLVRDPRVGGDAAEALSRSPSAAAMTALEKLAASDDGRRIALRAYVVRRVVRGERSALLDATIGRLAASPQAVDRALAVGALVAFGERSLVSGLVDPDARVRRAAAMGALALSPAARARVANAPLPAARDDACERVLATLVDDLATDGPSTIELLERARSGGADAFVAATALARRADDELAPDVDALFGSSDPVMRLHVALGLADSRSAEATGRLAAGYAFETDARVRRAIVGALAARTRDAASTARQDVLDLASHLDPDAVTREVASRARAGLPPLGPTSGHEVAWVRLAAAEGATLPQGMTASLLAADDVARPIVFDDDGYALVGGLPSGEVTVRLASRLASGAGPYDSR